MLQQFNEKNRDLIVNINGRRTNQCRTVCARFMSDAVNVTKASTSTDCTEECYPQISQIYTDLALGRSQLPPN
ncbi:MAG TPA: hypothetical protein DIT76_07275 [Spartobacteria bacterium]|nr:hypothetical protein [Spartobacteria bacterium]HCP91827.1 hypothetical protein [Spartobacteria bacterium]